MNIEGHLQSIKESLEEIEEAIKKGIEFRQRTIGFHTSVSACDMLEALLHKLGLVSPGFVVKHDWFNSMKKVKEKIVMEFPKKEKIITLMQEIEKQRNLLCYGKPKSKETIAEVIRKFNELKGVFVGAGLNEIEG
ncbi:MAG: hypothetical protein KKE23_02015 [Nanoarchaeota archaeon]|nr:hypothetical protein [Nanoarchaeota archaeon]